MVMHLCPATNVQVVVPEKLSITHYLPALLDPALQVLPCIGQLALDHTNSSLCVCLSSLNELRNPALHAQMRVCEDGVSLFVGPDEVSNVFGSDWKDKVCGGDADSDWN
jgi:hypothetical protein